MHTVSLAKALKIKNRLAGELKRCQQVLVRENSKLVGAARDVDCENVYQSIVETMGKLIQVKTEIAKANVGIYSNITRIAELKGLLAFYATIPTNDGKIKEEAGWREAVTFSEYNAVYKKVKLDLLSTGISGEIDKLQDEIDVYNANTNVYIDV
jgi:hypothetical protein